MSYSTLKFSCIRSGAALTLPFDDVVKELRLCHLVWVRLPGLYAYRLGGYGRPFFSLIDAGIRGAELEFMFSLHNKRCEPTTVEDIVDPDNAERMLGRGGLTARAYRYRCMFLATNDAEPWLSGVESELLDENDIPFQTVPAIDSMGRSTLGYRMKKGIRWLVVVTCLDDRSFDWDMLVREWR